MACVHMVAAADAYLPLAALLAYLWKYTWAAFPGFLRASLTSALLALQGRLTADERKDPAGMTAEEGAHTSACRIALLMCDALSWLAKGDDALDAWLRGDGAGKLLPCSQHFRPLMAVDNGRAFRCVARWRRFVNAPCRAARCMPACKACRPALGGTVLGMAGDAQRAALRGIR